jgi:single-strand DNA-binding protein
MSEGLNVCVLRGTLSKVPEVRALPSGSDVATYEVTVRRGDEPADSVPVAWFDPPSSATTFDRGDEVVVVGRVRRRFFRTAAGTQSRTEVVADKVVAATHRKRVDSLFDRAAQVLAGSA